MSYQFSEIKEIPFLSKEMNEFMTKYFSAVTPSKEYIADLPLPDNLKTNVKIKPCIVFKDISKSFFESILNFDIQSSDVFVCSLPKCGSSWMQTIAWLLTHDLNYDAIRTMKREVQMGDFDEILNAIAAKERASELLANDISKSLDEHTALKMGWNDIFKRLDTPRVIKTHYPIYFLPRHIWTKNAKVIYIVRNAKDMAVSLYYMLRNVFFVNITMDDIVNATINESVCSSPHLDHILEYWNARHLPNVLFITYEDAVNNSLTTIRKISTFLKCTYDDHQLKELSEFISFDNMKKIKSINREDDVVQMEILNGKKRLDSNFTFLRKGKAGGYRDDLNDEHIKKLDQWIAKRLRDSDFQFEI